MAETKRKTFRKIKKPILTKMPSIYTADEDLIKSIRGYAEQREWSFSKAVTKLIGIGLEEEVSE